MRNCLCFRHGSTGFTLTELLVSLSILTLLTALAAPSFGSMLNRNKVLAQSNTLLLSLATARSAAVLHREMVHVCQLANRATPRCSSDYSAYRDWSRGWMVFMDLDRDGEYSDKDELVYVFDGSPQIKLVFNQRGRLRFFPNGRARSAGFTICDSGAEFYHHIYILYSGRTRIKKTVTEAQRRSCDTAHGLI